MRLSDHSIFDKWPDEWPSQENHVIPHDVTFQQYAELRDLLADRAGEREIEDYLSRNREALAMIVWMFPTGHHMSWIFPKPPMRPSVGDAGGLVPDYLLAGANSFGVQYYILELKGSDKSAFVREGKRISLSLHANRGVCQLLNYLDFGSRDQAYLRDTHAFKQFREPTGVLLIGRDDEEDDPQVRDFKSAWNRFNPRLLIRSYDALLRTMAGKLTDMGRFPASAGTIDPIRAPE